MKHLLWLVIAGCASAGGSYSDGVSTADRFANVLEAAIEALHQQSAAAHDIQVDPRPLDPIEYGSANRFVTAPAIVAERTRLLREQGLARGDFSEASTCNTVAGMGGIMEEPLSPEDKDLLERCAKAFGGLTFGVSIPFDEEDGGATYRVVAVGSNQTVIWDVRVDSSGRVSSIHEVFQAIS